MKARSSTASGGMGFVVGMEETPYLAEPRTENRKTAGPRTAEPQNQVPSGRSAEPGTAAFLTPDFWLLAPELLPTDLDPRAALGRLIDRMHQRHGRAASLAAWVGVAACAHSIGHLGEL